MVRGLNKRPGLVAFGCMRPNTFTFLHLALCFFSAGLACGANEADLRATFKNPPRQYSTGPLWVWNDMLTDQQVRDTLRDLAGQKVKQVWVHPRPGLMTPYLSPEWFRLWKVALKEAERLDMNIWIYDENSYPSGFAGGWVPELMPESRGRGLTFKESTTCPKRSDDLVGVYRVDGSEYDNVTAKIKSGENLPDGRYLVASEVRAGNSPWHGNRCYVNLLSPGVTEKFLEVTMEAYRQEIGSQFGKRVPGVFTDEPNIRPAGGFPWSEVLLAEFKKRWGYDLLDYLPSLSRPVGDWRKIRHNYFQVLHEQFVEHWGKPYFNYCETNNLKFTGHYWDHDWPDCMGVPDNMGMYAWHQMPAIDCLMNQYAEHTHAQFGNVRMVKELSSVANQLGRKQTLCEAYGAGGWDLRFEDMKRIGDWLEVLGVNVLNQHLSYVTIRGARKRDHPQSFSYHAPWFNAYHVSAEYLARVSAALTQGEQVNKVLVLEPTTTAWMYQGNGQKLGEIGDAFFKLLMALEAAQIEYDICSEDILARHGRAEGNQVIIGQRSYSKVIIPPLTENWNSRTRDLLDRVTMFLPGTKPWRVDGAGAETNEGANQFIREHGEAWLSHLISDLKKSQQAENVYIERVEGDKGILFHHRRQLDEGELLFLVNTSIEQPSSGVVIAHFGGAESWDPHSGEMKPYPFAQLRNAISAKFTLPPSGSLLLYLPKKPIQAAFPHEVARVIQPAGGVEIRRLEPNVLTLDYVYVTAGGESRKSTYFYQANQFVWKKNGMERNPWDSAVQFKDELISKKFPADSGFQASYKFRITDQVPRDLAIVIERPDLYAITCNGQPIKARKGDWWLDKAFGRIPIAKCAAVGENIVTLTACPFTMFHELESAYLLGDFNLRSTESGFEICVPKPLTLGGRANATSAHSINPDGTMWLSGGVGVAGGNSLANDHAPFLVFDLGKPQELAAINIWNYNENHVRDLTARGAKQVRISGSSTGSEGPFEVELGTLELARGNGRESGPQPFPVSGKAVRFVRFDILANHYGTTYPVAGEAPDNAFVGLAEVQFVGSDRRIVNGVKVAKASSELPSHRRLAKYLVDGSGLGAGRPGWNVQGLPFYSAGISYSERFQVDRRGGKYVVSVPDWYGSVAKVTVNGKLAGYIDAPPWECDVTKTVKRGENTIEVTVIGTPKNLLGPHHNNPVLGAAWPGNFQQAPNPGPPPGDRYSTVGYGLFEPFVLKQITTDEHSEYSAAK